MKRKIILILLALVFVFSCVALVACNKGEKEALDTYLLEQDNQLVDADFTLPVKIREYDVTWTSSDSAITLEKRDSDYLAKVTLGDAVKEVTLTVSIGKLSKSFTVRVAEFDVYFIADHYNFVKDKTTVTEDFALDRSFTYQGKTATIDWSVSDAYADYIAISEDGNTCLVYPTSLLPSVRIKATFTYNNESTTYQYTMTVGLNRTHLEEINYWYYNTGVSIDIKGYVVEIATPYDEGYGNVSLYVVDEEFLAGYYVYRVKTDSANAALIEVGAHVTITGTTNTNYNGLIETNAGGNLVVDTDVPKIDVREHVYALDQDILGNVPAAIYHQSRLVSLTNWTVKSVKSAPEAGSTATLFTLTKGGVDVSVAVSKYLEGAYKTSADDATWSALAALTGTVKEGDVVSVTGVLGNYNGAQIMPLKASDVVVGGTADPDGTVYPGQTAAKAIAAVNTALKENGVDKRITKTTEFTLPTESNGVAIAYKICGSPRALTLDGSKFTVTPDKHEIATVKVTYTLKDGETVVYSTVQFFDVESLVPTASTIMDELVAPPTTALKDFELDSNEYATWEVVEGTGITIEGNTAKVSRTGEDQQVTLKVTVVYNNETKTKTFRISVPANPYYGYVPEVVTTPAAGTYKLFLQQEKLGKTLYFTGVMDGYYYETSEDIADAVDVVVANGSASGTYTFAFVDGTGATKYLYIAENDGHINVLFGDTPFDWTWEAERNVLIATVGTEQYYLGTYSTFNTISASELSRISDASVIGKTQFVARFVQMVKATDESKVAAELAALKVDKLTYTENGTATLPVAGTTHTDVTISWASNNAAVVVDGANLAVTMPASNAKVTLTATVKAGTVEKTKTFTLHLAVDVVDAAYALESGESLNGITLTGVIGKIDDAYSEQFGNITVTIVIDNRVDQPIQCFRLKGEGCDTLAVGDKITVTGNIVNYNGTIEFNSGCTLDAKTTATAEEIAIAEFAFVELAKEVTENFTLPEGITWTVKEGTAITIDGVNATVVRGDADATVVITGTLNGHTRDFTVVVKATDGGSVEPPVEDVMTVAEALAAANALGKDEYSAEKVYVEGVVTEITRFDSGRSSYTFYIKDADGTDQLTVFSCKTTADITKIYVGDTVKVYGYLKNHKGNTPEVTYQGDENPVFVTLTRGTSAITVAENDNVTVTLSAQSGENGTEFSFTIVVDTPEYVLASVAVNGTTVTATDGVYRAIIDGPTTVVVSGYVPSTETSNVTVDFKANFGTYGGSWSNSYAEHTITSADLGVDASEATFNVVLSNASKQTGTITDMPCLASKNTAQYVTVSLSSGTIAGVTFNLKEWSAQKMFTTITIEYTTDGATWQPTNVGLVDGTATTISPNFTTVSAVDLTEGVIGVRLVYVGNSSENQQIGLEGLTLTVK